MMYARSCGSPSCSKWWFYCHRVTIIYLWEVVQQYLWLSDYFSKCCDFGLIFGSVSCDFIASYVDMLLTCCCSCLQEVQDAFPLGSDLWCRPRLTCRENSLVNPPFCTWQKLQPHHHHLSLLIASQSALRSPLHLPAEFHLNIEIGAFWTKGWFKSDWRKSLLRLGGLAL